MDLSQILITLFQMICVVMVFAYLFTRSRFFVEVLEDRQSLVTRIILIVVFGLLSIYGLSSGLSISGAVVNIRDLGPILAGLICGPYVGIGAGLVGTVYRITMGGSNVIGAAIGPVLAGAMAGGVYLLNKRGFVSTPTAVIVTVIIESAISTVTLIIRLVTSPGSNLVPIIVNVAIPMIVLNAVAVAIFSTIVHNLMTERKTAKEKVALEHEIARKNAELEIAAEIQRSFLPETIPQMEGYDIAGTSIPAKEVGGDFFDVVPLQVTRISDRHMGLLVADVSGKGVPAALFMALSRVVVRVSATWSGVPSEVIRQANESISADSKTGMFVTLFYGVLDQVEKNFTYVNAGHNPPIVYRAATGAMEELEGTGIAIGLMDDSEYQQADISLASGDLIVLYTDGVTEAINEKEEMFGEERLMETIRASVAEPAAKIQENIISAVTAFSGTAPQYDDITLVVVRVQ
ncbi:MAG: SpoIIE family protein phosphatase [Methanoregulaceae archaeon]|nr:SpoIIE family protein phosphatase [Methanoregulaceae archaeon]